MQRAEGRPLLLLPLCPVLSALLRLFAARGHRRAAAILALEINDRQALGPPDNPGRQHPTPGTNHTHRCTGSSCHTLAPDSLDAAGRQTVSSLAATSEEPLTAVRRGVRGVFRPAMSPNESEIRQNRPSFTVF